jgi:galacturan 1,4-alpha-galacturonidase
VLIQYALKMLFRLSTICLFLSATLAIAHPSSENALLAERFYPEHPSSRPSVSCHPKSPGSHHPHSPLRSKICYIKSHNDGTTDDSSYVLSALRSCNNGGHVVFKKGVNYLIGKALDLTFLNHIDIGSSMIFPVKIF